MKRFGLALALFNLVFLFAIFGGMYGRFSVATNDGVQHAIQRSFLDLDKGEYRVVATHGNIAYMQHGGLAGVVYSVPDAPDAYLHVGAMLSVGGSPTRNIRYE